MDGKQLSLDTNITADEIVFFVCGLSNKRAGEYSKSLSDPSSFDLDKFQSAATNTGILLD